MDDREISCCFTGHRHIPLEKHDMLNHQLEINILWMLAHGICHFYNGAALGFDTMSAMAVLALKPSHPELKLHLALPCPEQTKFWKPQEIECYRGILYHADTIWYADNHYYVGTMMIRNRYMVDHSRFCLCYYDAEYAEQSRKSSHSAKKRGSGTFQTVEYARKQELSIFNLCDSASFSFDFDFDE